MKIKKSLYCCLCLVILFFVSCTFFACNATFLNGKSAYDIAVEHGFVGSETEWLESLKGRDGTNGSGKSAYEIAVEQGFEGTVTEWLTSLKGLNGLNGQDGQDGQDITVQSLFDRAVELGLYENNSNGYRSFLNDYFDGNISANAQVVASECLNQVVSIYTEDSLGSLYAGAGVFYKIDEINKCAYIITNYHVVWDENGNCFSSQMHAYTYGTETLVQSNNSISYGKNALSLTIVGGSPVYDLAVVKISGEDFDKLSAVQEVTIANTDAIQLGSTAISIGNPMGYGTAVTVGSVSCDSEDVLFSIAGVSTKIRCIRIDTPTNGGNSGGGLFDINGNLIGIVNGKKRDYLDENGKLVVYNNVNYAIAGTRVKNVVENILDSYFANLNLSQNNTSSVNRYLIGITMTIEDVKNTYNSLTHQNILTETISITAVNENSIAQQMGFEVGDKIVSITIDDGVNAPKVETITRMYQAIEASLQIRVGDNIKYTILRKVGESWQQMDLLEVEALEEYFEQF